LHLGVDRALVLENHLHFEVERPLLKVEQRRFGLVVVRRPWPRSEREAMSERLIRVIATSAIRSVLSSKLLRYSARYIFAYD
jgi:hypothetical protein